MPKLYVVNATPQIHQFTFWLPEASRSMIQEIPIGGQIVVANRDLPTPAIEAIVESKVKFGMIPVAEALSRGRVVFHGLAYQADRPVPLDKIYALIERYNSVLNQRGRQMRQEAAVASNQFLEERLFETAAAANRTAPRVDVLEMQVEEIARPRGLDDSAEINERVQVRRDADDNQRPAQQRIRRGRRT